MSDAVAGAACVLRLPDEQVDAHYNDINGERYRSEEWGFVALRTAAVWRSLQYEAPPIAGATSAPPSSRSASSSGCNHSAAITPPARAP